MQKFEAPQPKQDPVTDLFAKLTEQPTYKGTDPQNPLEKIVDEVTVKGTRMRVMHHTYNNGPFFLDFPQLQAQIGLGTSWYTAKQTVHEALVIANRPENDTPDKIFDAILALTEGE